MSEFETNNLPLIQQVKIYVEQGLNIKNACKKIGKSKYICFKNATSKEKNEVYTIRKKFFYRNSGKYLFFYNKKPKTELSYYTDNCDKVIQTMINGNSFTKACKINRVSPSTIRKYITESQQEQLNELRKQSLYTNELRKQSLYTNEITYEKIKKLMQEGNSFSKACIENKIDGHTYKKYLTGNQMSYLKNISFEIKLNKYTEI